MPALQNIHITRKYELILIADQACYDMQRKPTGLAFSAQFRKFGQPER